MNDDGPLWKQGEVLARLEGIEPRLESWDRSTAPSQIRLKAYLDDLQRQLGRTLDGQTGLFLHLEIDVGDSSRLSRGYDVENYLMPVVRRLGAVNFRCVSGTKAVSGGSRLVIGRAVPAPAPKTSDGWSCFHHRAGAGATLPAWKAGLREALLAAGVLPVASGPVEVQLGWRCSPQRNWSGLWKPTADAMGPILGEPDARNPFNPSDDRIVALAMHRVRDDAIGWLVDVGIWWRAQALPSQEPSR